MAIDALYTAVGLKMPSNADAARITAEALLGGIGRAAPILHLRNLGLDDVPRLTYTKIGAELGIRAARVSEMERKALRCMKTRVAKALAICAGTLIGKDKYMVERFPNSAGHIRFQALKDAEHLGLRSPSIWG